MTTWLGTVFAPPEPSDVRPFCQADVDSVGLFRATSSQAEWRQHLVTLNSLIYKARLGPALFTWVCIVGIYLLTRLLWGPKVAVLGLIFVALDHMLSSHVALPAPRCRGNRRDGGVGLEFAGLPRTVSLAALAAGVPGSSEYWAGWRCCKSLRRCSWA